MRAPIFKDLLGPILRPIVRPLSRILLGLIAIPLFRLILRRVFRIQELSEEMEKDLREWFRASLLLLVATANMELLLFSWFTNVDWLDRADWFTMGLRLLMVIGVIQTMPDQELFAILHPGPPKFAKGVPLLRQIRELKWQIVKGILCRHLRQSSPVLAMMSAIVGGDVFFAKTGGIDPGVLVATANDSIPLPHNNPGFHVSSHPTATARPVTPAKHYDEQVTRFIVGWVCYIAAISQYLIIGLVTSKDRAMKVLALFDQAVAERRKELIETYNLQDEADFALPDMPATD